MSRKRAPIVPEGDRARLGDLTAPGTRIILADGRQARLAWPTRAVDKKTVDGWNLRAAPEGGRQGEPEWHPADAVVFVRPTPMVSTREPGPGDEVDPLQSGGRP